MRRISALFSARVNDASAITSFTTSCIMWRLSKMCAAAGNMREKRGATSAVSGMTCGGSRSTESANTRITRSSAARRRAGSGSMSASYTAAWCQW